MKDKRREGGKTSLVVTKSCPFFNTLQSYLEHLQSEKKVTQNCYQKALKHKCVCCVFHIFFTFMYLPSLLPKLSRLNVEQVYSNFTFFPLGLHVNCKQKERKKHQKKIFFKCQLGKNIYVYIYIYINTIISLNTKEKKNNTNSPYIWCKVCKVEFRIHIWGWLDQTGFVSWLCPCPSLWPGLQRSGS